MIDILLVTTGKTSTPLINCIKSLKPTRVVFICTDDTRKTIDQVRDAVRIPSFDASRDLVLLNQRRSNKDDASVHNEFERVDLVYSTCWQLIRSLQDDNPGARISVDFTGGTKAMSAGLAMAAVDDSRVQLLYTGTEQRPADGEVTGHSLPTASPCEGIRFSRLVSLDLPTLLSRYDYATARAQVQRVRLALASEARESRDLRRLGDLLQALDAWDRFDHKEALDCFKEVHHDSCSSELLQHLKVVVGSRALLDPTPAREDWASRRGHGLEAVDDLLRNAERRAEQERYDDAVGRLYRAMELCAQLLLKVAVTDQVGPHGIDTGAVELDCLPAAIQPRWREVAVRKTGGDVAIDLKIALAEAYDLLADLGHPTGMQWSASRNKFTDTLQIRNHSLFAHGFSPISFSGWQRLSSLLMPFLSTAIDDHGRQRGMPRRLPQLPSTLAELMPTW